MEWMRLEQEAATGDAKVSLVRSDSHISEVLTSYEFP